MNHISYLDYLEKEALDIIRIAYDTFSNVALLFSGGKDSCVVRHLVQRHLSRNDDLPMYPRLLSIDTGYNFPQINEFLAQQPNIIIGRVQDSIDRGTVPPRAPGESRNPDQAVTLMEHIHEHEFDALFGGARRDEDRARAKERVFSHRDQNGVWRPENQRMELYGYYTDLRINPGEHFRVFPLSNWTEIDVWEYIDKYAVEIPSMYFAHPAEDGSGRMVRYRTIGDSLVTKPVESKATTPRQIIEELLNDTSMSERGATRLDDKAVSMEQRKRMGYF